MVVDGATVGMIELIEAPDRDNLPRTASATGKRAPLFGGFDMSSVRFLRFGGFDGFAFENLAAVRGDRDLRGSPRGFFRGF